MHLGRVNGQANGLRRRMQYAIQHGWADNKCRIRVSSEAILSWKLPDDCRQVLDEAELRFVIRQRGAYDHLLFRCA
jgi:hypothetical protein